MSQFKDYLNKIQIINEGKKEIISEKNKKAIEYKDLLSEYSFILIDKKPLHDLLNTKVNLNKHNKKELTKKDIEGQVVEIINKASAIHYGTEQKAKKIKEKIENLIKKSNNTNVPFLPK
jgi:hypothetical protein